MTIFQIEIIERTKDVGWNDTGEFITELVVHTSKIMIFANNMQAFTCFERRSFSSHKHNQSSTREEGHCGPYFHQ